MEDSRARFIEAATRPFADRAETRMAAKAWLEKFGTAYSLSQRFADDAKNWGWQWNPKNGAGSMGG
jgi:hypothetical protein